MPTPVIMPKFEMTQENATVVRWLIAEGDTTEQGDPILEVETDKVVMGVEAPAGGVLAGVTVREGDVVPVTEVIAYILQPGESLPDTPQKEVAAAPANIETTTPAVTSKATPVAVRVAAEAGVDINKVVTPGANNRVMRQDVEQYLAAAPVVSADRRRATPAARRIAREHNVDLAAINGSGPRGRIQAREVQAAAQVAAQQIQAPPAPPPPPVPQTTNAEIVPLQGMRKTIATRLQQSYQTAPHIMLTVEADVSALEKLRQELNAEAEAAGTLRVSVTALLVKICAWALRRHPWVNASLQGDEIHLHPAVNVGVAVALPAGKGLIVPVIRNAEELGLAEIVSQLAALTQRARQGQLTPANVSEGTFTVTNLGMFGIDHFTAIINPPQSAILAVGRSIKRPVVIERAGVDKVVIRPIMKMTLAVDHRVLDGAVAAQFLQDVVRATETPGVLLW